MPGTIELVKETELLEATLVAMETQLFEKIKFVEACSTLVLPVVNPVTSNRNLPAAAFADANVMGPAFCTVMEIEFVAVA